jgi:spore maturation protein CgeB
LLIAPARRLPEQRFLIGGAQYPENFPWTDNIFFVRHLDPSLHSAFYSSSRMTLNVTRGAMKQMGYCPSGRLFEAAACGTPILSDAWEGLDLFFAPGSEIIVVKNSDDVVGAMELPDDLLQRIAQRAFERTLDEHTAEHRARYLESVLENSRNERPTATASPSVALMEN